MDDVGMGPEDGEGAKSVGDHEAALASPGFIGERIEAMHFYILAKIDLARMRGIIVVLLGIARNITVDKMAAFGELFGKCDCLLYTSPSPRDRTRSRMP